MFDARRTCHGCAELARRVADLERVAREEKEVADKRFAALSAAIGRVDCGAADSFDQLAQELRMIGDILATQAIDLIKRPQQPAPLFAADVMGPYMERR